MPSARNGSSILSLRGAWRQSNLERAKEIAMQCSGSYARFFAEPVLSITRSFAFLSMTGREWLRMTQSQGLAIAKQGDEVTIEHMNEYLKVIFISNQ